MSRNEAKQITSDDIQNFTSQGKDVFTKELGISNFRKNISSPFRLDKNPSFSIKQSKKSGLWLYTDYTTGEWGTCIQFIEKLYTLSFQEAIDKIAWDFGLSEQINNKYSKIEIIPSFKIEEHKDIIYEYTETKFKKEHHNYWNAGHLEEGFLRQNNIFAASKIAVNKKVINVPKDELCFVYVPIDLEYGKLKILRMGKNVLPQDKWRSSVPNESYLWSYYEYNKNTPIDQLWVVKSRKDEMIAKLLGYNTVSVQSENWQNLDGNMPKIQDISKQQVLNFGSDDDGVGKCIVIQQKYNTLYYNTPKNLVQYQVNDLFSYSKEFGLQSLLKHIKTKIK